MGLRKKIKSVASQASEYFAPLGGMFGTFWLGDVRKVSFNAKPKIVEYVPTHTFPPCTKCGYVFKLGEIGHTCLPPVTRQEMLDWWNDYWDQHEERIIPMGDTTRPQQDPKPGKTSVTDLVLADIQERRQQGVAKYGTELKTENGRDPLVDLYQELLDAVMYVRQAIEERQTQPTQEEIVQKQIREGGDLKETLEQLDLFEPKPMWITNKKVQYHIPIVESVAQEAHRLVLGDRGAAYGHPIFDMTRSADMLTALLRNKLKPGARLEAEDIGQAMICVKQSRHRNAPKRDNNTDTAGYALTLEMIAEWRRANPGVDPRDVFPSV